VLKGVLGLLSAAEHVPAKREQRTMMPIVDRLERSVIAPANPRDQPLIAQRA
jgi:hypothetical protein